MSENTKIEWADMTFNPWRGCSKVSPGCKFCYAERQAKRNPAVLGQWGRGRISVRGKESYLQLPHKWEKLAAQGLFRECAVCGKREFRKWDRTIPPGGLSCCSTPDCLALPESETNQARPRVFCLSFGDWLDQDVPIEWLAELLETIRMTPHLDWLLLTKRPENFNRRMKEAFIEASWKSHLADFIWTWGAMKESPANVWVGTSVEDQTRADERIPELLKIPAHRRFLSCEPLLEPVNLRSNRGGTRWLGGQRGCEGQHHGKGTPDCPKELHHHHDDTCNPGIDWVIAGGESESKDKARPFALEWALDLQQQCASAGVPFFLKQLGSNPYVENANLWDWPIDEDLVYTDLPPSLNCQAAAAAGVKLRHKKGADREEWPDQLQAREFPKG